MGISKTKNYALTCLAFTLLPLFLLLILAGCDATSDPRIHYQTTGSWQGTLDGKRVRGIIAPSGRYHLAVVDATGAFLPGAGEYVGEVKITDLDNNIGMMTDVAFLRDPLVSAVVLPSMTFKLSGTRLYSEDAPSFDLSRVSDAGPGLYSQADVAGRWSFSLDGKIANVVVDATGNFSGDDFVSAENGANCQYSGTLKLIDSSWNIFTVSGPPHPSTGITGMTITELPNKTCPEAGRYYSGLAMSLAENRLWLVANRWENTRSSTGTFFGQWTETINVQPTAKMAANMITLEETVVPTIEVKKLSEMIQLDGQGSFDGNNDPLTYEWSVTNPLGTALNIPSTERLVSFSPGMEGVFTLKLKVYDALVYSEEIVRQIAVTWVPDRFVDCYNGTVLDTTTNKFWLKDAGCDGLHYLTPNFFWVNLDLAKARVASLADGGCSLTDGSVATDWRLPLRVEFASIIEPNDKNTAPLYTNPALANAAGTGQWQEGDVFVNVGKNPHAPLKIWIYWTSDEDGIGNYVNFGYQELNTWFGFMAIDNANAVWPVRDEISAVAGDEINACLDAVAPSN